MAVIRVDESFFSIFIETANDFCVHSRCGCLNTKFPSEQKIHPFLYRLIP